MLDHWLWSALPHPIERDYTQPYSSTGCVSGQVCTYRKEIIMSESNPDYDEVLNAIDTRTRTVTGSNLSGTVRVISKADILQMLADARSKQGGNQDSAEMAALQSRIAELEALLKDKDAEQQAAVEAAQQAANARIQELEAALANDMDKERLAFLEKEVERLGALVDRYATGLEMVTSLEKPDTSNDLARIDALADRVPSGPLAVRLKLIKQDLQAAERALSEGLQTINVEGKGWIYAVTDLLEHSIAATHLRQELLSIEQAMS